MTTNINDINQNRSVVARTGGYASGGTVGGFSGAMAGNLSLDDLLAQAAATLPEAMASAGDKSSLLADWDAQMLARKAGEGGKFKEDLWTFQASSNGYGNDYPTVFQATRKLLEGVEWGKISDREASLIEKLTTDLGGATEDYAGKFRVLKAAVELAQKSGAESTAASPNEQAKRNLLSTVLTKADFNPDQLDSDRFYYNGKLDKFYDRQDGGRGWFDYGKNNAQKLYDKLEGMDVSDMSKAKLDRIVSEVNGLSWSGATGAAQVSDEKLNQITALIGLPNSAFQRPTTVAPQPTQPIVGPLPVGPVPVAPVLPGDPVVVRGSAEALEVAHSKLQSLADRYSSLEQKLYPTVMSEAVERAKARDRTEMQSILVKANDLANKYGFKVNLNDPVEQLFAVGGGGVSKFNLQPLPGTGSQPPVDPFRLQVREERKFDMLSNLTGELARRGMLDSPQSLSGPERGIFLFEGVSRTAYEQLLGPRTEGNGQKLLNMISGMAPGLVSVAEMNRLEQTAMQMIQNNALSGGELEAFSGLIRAAHSNVDSRWSDDMPGAYTQLHNTRGADEAWFRAGDFGPTYGMLRTGDTFIGNPNLRANTGQSGVGTQMGDMWIGGPQFDAMSPDARSQIEQAVRQMFAAYPGLAQVTPGATAGTVTTPVAQTPVVVGPRTGDVIGGRQDHTQMVGNGWLAVPKMHELLAKTMLDIGTDPKEISKHIWNAFFTTHGDSNTTVTRFSIGTTPPPPAVTKPVVPLPPAPAPAPAPVRNVAPPTPWSYTATGNGTGTIDLGTHTIALNEANMEWLITDKATGGQTRIWGDPHVDYDNDGSTDIDFKGNLNLMIGNIKINVQTVPFGGTGETLSSKLVITDGRQGMTVGGLAAGYDGANNMSVSTMDANAAARAWDTYQHDQVVYQGNDGDWYVAAGRLTQGALKLGADGKEYVDFSKVETNKKLPQFAMAEQQAMNGMMYQYMMQFAMMQQTLMTNLSRNNEQNKNANSQGAGDVRI
jgi:hypothetical protein